MSSATLPSSVTTTIPCNSISLSATGADSLRGYTRLVTVYDTVPATILLYGTRLLHTYRPRWRQELSFQPFQTDTLRLLYTILLDRIIRQFNREESRKGKYSRPSLRRHETHTVSLRYYTGTVSNANGRNATQISRKKSTWEKIAYLRCASMTSLDPVR